MIFLYNILQVIILCFCWPFILLAIPAKRKYRKTIPARLGWGLKRKICSLGSDKKTIWIHALSVGEVTSVLPLVLRIREILDANLVFSVTTHTGTTLAENIIAPHVDLLVPYPLDMLPIVRQFIRLFRPDLFILVETDFWPNMLDTLAKKNIPSILVNGRISQKSMTTYKRFQFFFKPLFSSFSALCMQTAVDCDNMINLGIPENRIFNLGNLKYDHSPISGSKNGLPGKTSGIRIVAGSTHSGEEKIILSVFKKLQDQRDDISLVIAPRDIARGREIQHLAVSLGFTASCLSDGFLSQLPKIFILDTIGELAKFYHSCDIAFVGGSLVEEGGHNPIEPAIAGVPVLFGPHMEDFSEVAEELIGTGGAFQVLDIETMYLLLQKLIKNPDFRNHSGAAALTYIKKRQGVIEKHMELIRKFL